MSMVIADSIIIRLSQIRTRLRTALVKAKIVTTAITLAITMNHDNNSPEKDSYKRKTCES